MTAKTLVKSKSRLVLLDAHAIIHRAYHALPDFSTASGEPTGALYGLVAMLIKIIEELKPDYIVAAFDLPEKTHRHEAYEAYKGTRKEIDKNLVLQLERAKEVFTAWGIPIYSCPGFEADDVLGTVVEDLKKDKDIEIVIASGDMDTMSLISGKKVQVYTLRKGLNDTILYDEKRVEERFGFGPEFLPDYKGLRGDPSDNIIGVKGIGEKTATTLIQTFGTIEKIYKALKKKDEYKKAGITERVRDLLLENEEEALFSKTLATIRHDAPIDFKLPKNWREEFDMTRITELFQKLEFRTMPERVKRLGYGHSVSIPKTSLGESDQAVWTPSVNEDEKLKLALWVVDSNITNPDMEDVMTFTKTKTLEEAWKVVNTELEKRKQKEVFENIERPLVGVVEEMNKVGVKVDKSMLKELSKSYHKELSKLESQILKHAGEEFNINSPKQLGEILFTKMGLAGARQKKTASGGFSTKESELEKLKDKHEVIELILNYRELQKLLSTYIDSIPDQLDKAERLHSTFILSGSTTGRMASQNPNLQNIPVRTELGRAIREAFISEKGKALLSLDYSQIELRIAAILSEDKKLIEIFKEGIDVHTGVAMRVFGVKAEEVDKAMRTKAKTINFGVLFGMGVNALKVNLKTDRKDAQEFYDNYFETFSGLARYLDRVKAETERRGYTETMFGRRRYFSGIKSPLSFIRAQAERMAINAPIQGTEADIVKIAMKRIDDLIKKNKWQEKTRLVLQVHDEIVYETDDDFVSKAGKEFKNIMERVLEGKETYGVPIVAEANAGKNWNDLKKI
ncbi:MAG: DNA polymerase [Patescibacteria group bacterium]